MDATAKYEKIKIPLREAAQGITEVSAILGTPEWWPTGQRIGVVLAHGAHGDMNDPLLVALQSSLTAQRYLTLRFNFPFAEARQLATATVEEAPNAKDAKDAKDAKEAKDAKKPRKSSKKTKDKSAAKLAEVDAPEVLVEAYRSAITFLLQDSTSMPAHLFVGGQDIGGRTAGQLSAARARINGVFYLGYPLHPPGKPDAASARDLFRVISPMLFIQGSRDPHCEIDALRRTLLGVGAPTALRMIEDADANWTTSQSADASLAARIDPLLDPALAQAAAQAAPSKVFVEISRTLQKWIQSLVRS